MTRRVVVLAAVLGSFLATSTADVSACGDKFLRIGRSPRAYAAVHRAAILLYVPKALQSNVKNYEKALKRAGHRPTAVRDFDALSNVLTANKYDIVITSLAEAMRIRELTAAAPAQPTLLPLVSKDANAASPQTSREFPHQLEDHATAREVFEEIDRVMELRLSNLP